MKLNTIVNVPGRGVGTICYKDLDGHGGVWGRHQFDAGDGLPEPEFMLREPEAQRFYPAHTVCVGEDFTIEGE